MNLKENLATYKLENLIIKKEYIDLFGNTDAIFEEIKYNYYQFDNLLETGKVNLSEFDTLKKIIKNFEKNFRLLHKLFAKNEDKIDVFNDLRDHSVGIIETFQIVKDVSTLQWGDYVSDVKKDTLCSVNSEKLEFILDTFKKISSDSGESEYREELPNSCNLWLILAQLLSKFESEFIINVVYRRPTEIMRELIEISRNIDYQFNIYKKTISSDYFSSDIDNSLANIEILESKCDEKNSDMIKLTDLIGPKKNASSLFAFRDSLKYSLKFSKVN